MMWLRKSKKGFTLIELMVVVAIIGVLVLLGLRAYSSQKERAMNSIVKANAGTVQTMLVGYMGDNDILSNADIIVALTADIPLEKMVNPYNSAAAVYVAEGAISDFVATIDVNQGVVACRYFLKGFFSRCFIHMIMNDYICTCMSKTFCNCPANSS